MNHRSSFPHLLFLGIVVHLTVACSLLPPAELIFTLDGIPISTGDVVDFGAIDQDAPTSRTVDIEVGSFGARETWEITIETTDLDIENIMPFFADGGGSASNNEGGWFVISAGADALHSNSAKSGTVTVTSASGTEQISFEVTASVTGTQGQVIVSLDGSVVLDNFVFVSAATSQPVGSVAGYGTNGAVIVVANGSYAFWGYDDLDVSGGLTAGDAGAYQLIDVDGHGSFAAAVVTVVDEPITVVNAGTLPDGALVCAWLIPGSSLSGYLSLDVQALVSGVLTPTVGGDVVPGSYDLYCYVDADNGLNLGTYPPQWDADNGEMALLTEDVVATDGTTLDGNDFVAIP